jgi:hypothetical protein
MEQIKQEILSIDVVDVTVIGVCPTDRPRIDNNERVTGISKLRLVIHDYRFADRELVLASKMGTEFVDRDTGTPTRGTSMSPVVLSRSPFGSR